MKKYINIIYITIVIVTVVNVYSDQLKCNITNLYSSVSFCKDGMIIEIENPNLSLIDRDAYGADVKINLVEDDLVRRYTVPFAMELGVSSRIIASFGVDIETLPAPFENKGFLARYFSAGHSSFGVPSKSVTRIICPDPSDPSGKSVVLIKQEELEDFYKKQGFDPEKELAERAERRRTQKAEIEKIQEKAIYAIDKQYPVQFPEGEWSADLKTFIIKDLNRLFGAAEVSYRGPVAKGPITRREILYRKYTPLYSREWLVQCYELGDVDEANERFAEFDLFYILGNWEQINTVLRIEYDDTEMPIFCVTEEGMKFYEHAVEKYGEIHKSLQAFFDPDRCEPMQNLFYDGYENFLKDERFIEEKSMLFAEGVSTYIYPSILSFEERDGFVFANMLSVYFKRAGTILNFGTKRLCYRDGKWVQINITDIP